VLAVPKARRWTWDDLVGMALCDLSLEWAPDPWPGIAPTN
jgi:hypothetical protein